MKEKDKTELLMFEPLAFPRKDAPQLLGIRYRVYSDSRNFTLIEAESALEAIKASGIKTPYKILRDTIMLNNLLDISTISGESNSSYAPAVEKNLLSMDEIQPQAGQDISGAASAAGVDTAMPSATGNEPDNQLTN